MHKECAQLSQLTQLRSFSNKQSGVKGRGPPGMMQDAVPASGAPRQYRKTVDEVYNPVLFNKVNELYVIKGKEKVVGLWLGIVSASIFGMVWLGGYTRLTKSGLSMVRWEPHRILPPITREEWDLEFEEYKKSPEWILVNSKKGMDVNGFKYIFFWEWAHRILGRSIGFTFFLPMVYFWGRGYLQSRLKATLISLFAFGGLQGVIGWWMVKSGLVDKKDTKEIDKTPRVSPYRLATHAGFAYVLYAVCLQQTFNILRRPQEAVINTFEKVGAVNAYRSRLYGISRMVIPVVLLTGFFTAGTNAGISCNTYPWVGDKWFYSSKHFLNSEEVPLWKNFTENKLICQVNHRTIATLLTFYATIRLGAVAKHTKILPKAATRSIWFLIFVLWMQLTIGVNTIWQNVPIQLASLHQVGAMVALSALVFANHNARRVDPRQIQNLLGKLKLEDRSKYEKMVRTFGKDVRAQSKIQQASRAAQQEQLNKFGK